MPAGACIFAGGVLLVIAATGRKTLRLERRMLGQLTLLGVTQTSVQYVFFYIGLARATGVKSSVMKITSTFFSVLLAHCIYKNDWLSLDKALGCVVVFLGVMTVNFNAGLLSFDFTLIGEGFVVAATFGLSALFLDEKILACKKRSRAGHGMRPSGRNLSISEL